MTSKSSNVRAFVVAVEFSEAGTKIYQDWELLVQLNDLLSKRTLRRDEAMVRPTGSDSLEGQVMQGKELIEDHMDGFDLPFEVPEVDFMGALWPGDNFGI